MRHHLLVVRESLFDRVFSTCAHQFSWPRRTEDRGDYQVCLRCGAEYSYDWRSMRRTKRLRDGGHDTVSTQMGTELPQARKPCPRSNWKPLERRLKINVPVLYREKGTTRWRRGKGENISRSGLLFRAPAAPAGAQACS